MRKRNIVIGQRVDLDKVKRARMLRGQMTEEERILWERLRANYLPILRGTLSPPRFGEGLGEGSFPRLFRRPELFCQPAD